MYWKIDFIEAQKPRRFRKIYEIAATIHNIYNFASENKNNFPQFLPG